MAIDKECQLKAALGNWGELGFSLTEIDSDFAQLKFKDTTIGYYNQTKLTVETLQRDCQSYWNENLQQFTGTNNV